jgi:hypothetical protein
LTSLFNKHHERARGWRVYFLKLLKTHQYIKKIEFDWLHAVRKSVTNIEQKSRSRLMYAVSHFFLKKAIGKTALR